MKIYWQIVLFLVESCIWSGNCVWLQSYHAPPHSYVGVCGTVWLTHDIWHFLLPGLRHSFFSVSKSGLWFGSESRVWRARAYNIWMLVFMTTRAEGRWLSTRNLRIQAIWSSELYYVHMWWPISALIPQCIIFLRLWRNGVSPIMTICRQYCCFCILSTVA